jgi:hypothetical protein
MSSILGLQGLEGKLISWFLLYFFIWIDMSVDYVYIELEAEAVIVFAMVLYFWIFFILN